MDFDSPFIHSDMLFSKEENTPHTINRYTKQSITINGVCYDSPILVGCQGITSLSTTPNSLSDINLVELIPMLAGSLLVLAKDDLNFYELESLRLGLLQKDISLEAMPIGSACRTYNVLQSEGREASLLVLFK